MPSGASPPAVVEALRAVGRAMRTLGRKWYVFGAQAAIFYGRPRMTADIDVTLDVEPIPRADVIAVLGAEGICQRWERSAEDLAASRLLPLVHVATSMPIDAVVAGAGLELEFMARARVVEIGGADAPIVSPEDLIVMKVLAGRRKDLDDVRSIVSERSAELDWEHVRSTLTELAAAVGDPRLLPRLERLSRGRVRRPQ